jgi:hypothetical protein
LYCATLNVLVEKNLGASSRYHRAITHLAKIAGQELPANFAEAKTACTICLEECQRTVRAIKKHKLDHGC